LLLTLAKHFDTFFLALVHNAKLYRDAWRGWGDIKRGQPEKDRQSYTFNRGNPRQRRA
jgi:hypothetical protein